MDKGLAISIIISAFIGGALLGGFIASNNISASMNNESPTETSSTESYMESAKIIAETNSYRTNKGLAALEPSPELINSACAKVDDMITKQYWAHDAPDGTAPWYFINQAGYRYSRAGENLAYGFNDEKVLVNSWIGSPSHEENLRGDYIEIGVCSKHANYMGKSTWVTVSHYGTPSN